MDNMETIALQVQTLPGLIIVGATATIILLTIAGTILVQHLLTKLKLSNRGCGKDVDTCSKEKCIALHKKDRTYLIIIFGIIITFILVDLFVGDKDALNYFSFASTIASIILSVLACILRRPTAAGAVSSGRRAVRTAACN